MRRWLAARRRSDRGAVIPMVALSLTVLMTMTAFAVDLGRMRTERRDLQADADALALDAVQMIRGLDAVAALPVAQAEAAASAVRNSVDPGEILSVEVGTWHVPTQTFTSMTSGFPDSVRVILTDMVDMFFDFSTDERSVTRTGVAKAVAQTRGGLGSVVAGIQPDVEDPTSGCAVGVAASIQMTVMNHVYTELLGIQADTSIEGEVDEGVDENQSCQVTGPNDGLQLDVASYRGLGASEVTFGDLASAFGVATTDELLDLSVTQAELLEATAQALQTGQDPTTTRYQVGTQLLAIASELDSSTTVVLGDVFQGTTGSSEAAADASLAVLDLLFATATTIDGNNFVGGGGGLVVPLPLGDGGTTVNVPMKVHVIEPPQYDTQWKFAGQDGPRTSQVSVTLDVPIALNNVPVNLSGLGIPGLGSTGTVSGTGTLPLVIEVGRADSSYTSIQCPADGSPSTVDMAVDSGAARIRVAKTTDTNFADGITVTTPGSIVASGSAQVSVLNLLGIPITTSVDMVVSTNAPSYGQTFTGTGSGALDASASLNVGGGETTNQFTFVPPGPTDWFRYRGGFNNVAVSDSAVGSFNFGTTSSGLIGTLTLAQSRLTRNQLVQGALDPVLQRLDTTVLQPLFNALGLTVGGADAQILDVRCQVPALANRG